ncbi:MAG TPA: lysophospholipid acyltransferase family protein [Dongiaceae bacterium]|jgi:putative hemolysin|nr:lysophospholipid acyltransferase family protein [Dongiaceae bacterium]
MPAAVSSTPIDLSYASPCDSRLTRALIHVIEATTGQLELKRLYNVYQTELRGTVDFWEAAMRLMRLSVDYDAAKLDALPRTGPLVIVANHPFGLIDGLLIGHLANRVRRDFKVLTNSRLYPPDAEIRSYILPIDFDPTPTAQETNLRSRAVARAHIKSGGCIIVFPAGGVATTPSFFARKAVDFEWKPFTARLVHDARADVVPIFFPGQNSRMFQIASHIGMTARMAYLLHEVANKIGGSFSAVIGDVLPYDSMSAMRDPRVLCRYLRDKTEALSANPRFEDRVGHVLG